MELPVKDRYGRPVRRLRISITEKCNLSCIYCHKEGVPSSIDGLTVEQIRILVETLSELGISKIKITGGEPLVRKDVVEIVGKISHVKGIEEVSLTTNGVLLETYAYRLAEAGLKRVNVSLPSLIPERYQFITGSKYEPSTVVAGIESARNAGLKPIKINMVLLKGVNEDEVSSLLEFARSTSAILQLIELEPVGAIPFYKRYHRKLDDFEKFFADRAAKIVERSLHGRKQYYLDDGGVVEIVAPVHNSLFCLKCDRIRVTSDGKFKPCLMRTDNHLDFTYAFKSDNPKAEIRNVFLKAVSIREPFYKG